ncbi:hypothetical protein Cal6303_0550 [Calothrix sp. PCC 6303]|nr:hypothetical protein Cal6303_0550 [Calothrix sp. PCC 6303]
MNYLRLFSANICKLPEIIIENPFMLKLKMSVYKLAISTTWEVVDYQTL